MSALNLCGNDPAYCPCSGAHSREEVEEQYDALHDAAKKALIPIAAWKITDDQQPYVDICPELRRAFRDAHSALLQVLGTEAAQ